MATCEGADFASALRARDSEVEQATSHWGAGVWLERAALQPRGGGQRALNSRMYSHTSWQRHASVPAIVSHSFSRSDTSN